MVKGLYLTLKTGLMKPTSVPREVIDALDSIQVHTTAEETASGFELKFNLGKRSPLNTLFFQMGGDSVSSLIRVVIIITVNGRSEMLMDGVMTHHDINPGSGSNPSTMTIRGRDLTVLMDYLNRFQSFPATSPAARVRQILSKYAELGVEEQGMPSFIEEVPHPNNRIPMQIETDLEYINDCASDTGYTFYIEPGPDLEKSIAYWGPQVRYGEFQPPLNVDMDAHTNVETLDFSFDDEAAKQVELLPKNAGDKRSTVPQSDVSRLKPPLSKLSPMPKKEERLEGLAKFSPGEMALLGLAEASKSSDAVTASGSLDVLRYGHILKARRPVCVRGAGEAFDGQYFVKSVTHNIKRGEYKQSFTLVRGGLISSRSSH